MITKASNSEDMRPAVLQHLKDNQFKRVVDVGGVMMPWAREFVTMYADILDPHEYLPQYEDLYDDNLKRAEWMQGDINDDAIWKELFHYTDQNGMFDFAICTHTIEDIRNPMLTLKMLPAIAKEGFIAIPTKHVELCFGIECPERDWQDWGIHGRFRGFMHHRWIFTVKEGVLWAFPKLNFLDHMTGLEWADLENKSNHFHELAFWWSQDGGIPYKIINDDYLGPNGPSVTEMYRTELKEGL